MPFRKISLELLPASSPRLRFVAVLPERVGHKMSNSILTKHQKNNQKVTKQTNKHKNHLYPGTLTKIIEISVSNNQGKSYSQPKITPLFGVSTTPGDQAEVK